MKGEFQLRLYQVHEDGGYEQMIGTQLSHFAGVLPAVGDTLTIWHTGSPYSYFEVVGRHFIEPREGTFGWAIMVRGFYPDSHFLELIRQWVSDTEQLG